MFDASSSSSSSACLDQFPVDIFKVRYVPQYEIPSDEQPKWNVEAIQSNGLAVVVVVVVAVLTNDDTVVRSRLMNDDRANVQGDKLFKAETSTRALAADLDTMVAQGQLMVTRVSST